MIQPIRFLVFDLLHYILARPIDPTVCRQDCDIGGVVILIRPWLLVTLLRALYAVPLLLTIRGVFELFLESNLTIVISCLPPVTTSSYSSKALHTCYDNRGTV